MQKDKTKDYFENPFTRSEKNDLGVKISPDVVIHLRKSEQARMTFAGEYNKLELKRSKGRTLTFIFGEALLNEATRERKFLFDKDETERQIKQALKEWRGFRYPVNKQILL